MNSVTTTLEYDQHYPYVDTYFNGVLLPTYPVFKRNQVLIDALEISGKHPVRFDFRRYTHRDKNGSYIQLYYRHKSGVDCQARLRFHTVLSGGNALVFQGVVVSPPKRYFILESGQAYPAFETWRKFDNTLIIDEHFIISLARIAQERVIYE